MGTGFTRRRFLSTLGAGAFLALTSGCGLPGRAQKLRSSRIPKASPLRAPKVWPLPGVSPVLPKGVWAFRSRPDLAPAAAEVTGRTSGTAPSDVFLALKEGTGEHGPMILDNGGQPVWFGKCTSARDFKAQRYRGRPVLTWWEGSVVAGHGDGEYASSTMLPGDLPYPRGQGIPWGPARVPHHPTGHRAAHRLRGGGGAGGSVPRRRREVRRGMGRYSPGGGYRDRRGSLRVAQPRSRRRRGVLRRAARRPRLHLRLLPHQLHRSRLRRRLAHLGAKHLDRLQGRPPERRGPVAPGRQGERLRDGRRHQDHLPARCPPPGGWHHHNLRQQRAPAGTRAVASDPASPRRGGDERHVTARVRLSREGSLHVSGERATLIQRKRDGWIEQRTLLLRVFPRRQDAPERRISARMRVVPGIPLLLERSPRRHPSPSVRAKIQKQCGPARKLDRRRGGRNLGGDLRSTPERAGAFRLGPRDGFETAMLAQATDPYVAARARNSSGEILGTSAPVKL